MEYKIIHIEETDSTNRWLKAHGEGTMVVVADYQTAGKGCGTNRWYPWRSAKCWNDISLRFLSLPRSTEGRLLPTGRKKD